MKIKTGQGTIPLLTLLAIWSISAITSLPGLAVTPILGDLDKIFSHVSDEEIQMLSAMPNLLIIPFVLLSGKICESKGKIVILVAGMSIFLASGILYFFAKSMMALILISCLLGIGAGMIIPLSTGLIADAFSGNYRTKQLGYSSSIQNLILVFATFLTGWLANINWHMPFLVYMLPAVGIVLANFLRPKYMKNNTDTVNNTTVEVNNITSNLIKPDKQMNMKLLLGLMIIYFFSSYLGLFVSFNVPFVIQDYNMSSDVSGIIIAILFLAIMLPGMFITHIIKWFNNYIIFVSFILIAIGLLFIVFFKSIILIGVGTFLVGFGYGIVQPLMYAKTVLVVRPKKAIMALALLMAMNYIAIVLIPIGVNFFNTIFHQKEDVLFPFIVNVIIAGIITLIGLIWHKDFIFSGEGSVS